jgi:hypothetical protein
MTDFKTILVLICVVVTIPIVIELLSRVKFKNDKTKESEKLLDDD